MLCARFVRYLQKKERAELMQHQEIILSQCLERDLSRAIGRIPYDKLFVLTDETTLRLCWPIVSTFHCFADAEQIVIKPGDEHKNLETLSAVWEEMGRKGGTRHSLLVNVGGGMVTDLGGFAASSFKRGVPYINVPTTLLAMVDAAVGGKTGINFNGLKNEIGAFFPASTVLIDTDFLKTLDCKNVRSGYAEMLKHGLISDEKHWAELVNFDLEEIDYGKLQVMAGYSINVKKSIVEQDPTEKGIRKALNLGHTVGHALESFALKKGRPVLHGYAVAWGLVCELYLSALREGFPQDKLRQTINFIKAFYGSFPFDCKDYETLYELMTHDKKNCAGRINFTLLGGVGDIRINQAATKDEIFNVLDFYCETF